jgi:hypothetical protein
MPDALKYVAERNLRDHLGGSLRQMWDFSVNGGAVGVAELDVLLPKDAIITGGFVDVVEAVTTSDSGTLSFGLNTNVDLLAATAAGSLTAGAVLPLLPSLTAEGTNPVASSTPLRLTAERELKAAVATGALTGGKVAIYLEFVGPAPEVKPVIYRKA